MNSTLFLKLIGCFAIIEKASDIISNWTSFSFYKTFINIQRVQLYNEEFMSFLLKIIIISVVTVMSLFIGGWIASRIIKMENRNNLIDW